MQQRHTHVGYYLIDKGFPAARRHAWVFIPPSAWRVRAFVRDSAEDFYISGIHVLSLRPLALCFSRFCLRFDSALRSCSAFLLLLAPDDAIRC